MQGRNACTLTVVAGNAESTARIINQGAYSIRPLHTPYFNVFN